jgi:hypothetical protein
MWRSILMPGSGQGSTDSHGQEAIDTLLKEMDDRKDFVVILAGYGKEMTALLNTNPGWVDVILRRLASGG